MSPPELPFWDAVESIRDADPRFRREAYAFVMAALGVTVQSLPAARLADAERRHLSGAELLRGIVDLARREFGPLAPTVFAEWGVRRTEDFGTMVFQLVGAGQLSARPEDRPEDFRTDWELARVLVHGVSAPPRPRSEPGTSPGGSGRAT